MHDMPTSPTAWDRLGQPRLYSVRAVLSFPFFQRLVIPAHGLNDFTGMRIFVDLHRASLSYSFCGSDGCSARLETILRVKGRDDVLQALVILA